MLPEESSFRQYMEAELEVVEMLKSPEVVISYPLSGDHPYFSSGELLALIEQMPGEKVAQIDITKLHENALKMQQLSSDGKFSEITLGGIYEMVIIRMVECYLLKEVIVKIRELIELQVESPYNFMYTALLIEKIVPEMIEENRNLILKCSSHLFSDPMKLLSLLDRIMTIKATSLDYR